MKRIIHSVTLATLVVSTACVASPRMDRFTVSAMPAPVAAATEAVEPDARRLDDHLEAGRAHADRREWRDARREYDAAAELIRARGELPAEPMRWIALSYFYERDFSRAARALDSLAAEAGVRGRPDVRAQALIDAAWVYGTIGQGDAARVRVSQVEKIVGSPFVPDSTRRMVARRIGR